MASKSSRRPTSERLSAGIPIKLIMPSEVCMGETYRRNGRDSTLPLESPGLDAEVCSSNTHAKSLDTGAGQFVWEEANAQALPLPT
jgi:hypothetical protein